MFLNLDKYANLKFTDDGYLVSNGCYLGVKDDNDFDWYGDLDLCKENLKPVLNVRALDGMLDYIDFVQCK